jgi:hypothetical protein
MNDVRIALFLSLPNDTPLASNSSISCRTFNENEWRELGLKLEKVLCMEIK